MQIEARGYAANHLIPYILAHDPNYVVADFHRKIAHALEAVERGVIERLMIFAPPRHGKTMEVSEYFPAWFMGRNPDKYVIAGTYSQDLADDNGRSVRDKLLDPLHQEIFPNCTLRDDTQSVRKLWTEAGGKYFTTGVGGTVTGRGAHVFLIDDPIKGRQEADSETYRRRLKDWYRSVARTRLMPGGAIIVMQTRWHEDDLSGFILREMKHEKWHVLSFPAINEQGKALWPEAFNEDDLESIRKSVAEREWNALFMQRPSDEGGGYFKRDWFNRYDVGDEPENLRTYGASDYAVTADDGDYTEMGIAGVDAKDDLYLTDWYHGQDTSDVWAERQCDLILKHKPVIFAGEKGVIQKAVEPYLTRRMRERRAYCRMEWLPSIADKATRARSFQALASMGKVWIPNTEWGDRLVAQLISFPTGRRDDGVDVCSLLGRMVDQMRGIKKLKEPVLKRDRYDVLFNGDDEEESWRTL